MAPQQTASSSSTNIARAAVTEPRGWQGWWPRRIGWRLALGFGVLVALMLVALALPGVMWLSWRIAPTRPEAS